MPVQKKKIVVALSGGVDSAVAAALLLDQGYEVIGAFMKNWSGGKSVRGMCNWKEERRDAMRVAAHLGIPLVTFDFEKEYRERVASYLFREYADGQTPNPDVLCNSEVKFPLLWREAQKLGADLIATGHHVRSREYREYQEIKNIKTSKWQLLAGKDANKDQSYFLHQLTQEDLEHTFFPIGEYIKEEVRKMALERGLPTADKRSTRGICFVGKVSMRDFLEQAIPARPGFVCTTNGEVLGEHRGIAPFTIGQRHGFSGGGGTPYYVVKKEVETNTLIVTPEDDPALYKNQLELADVHWIAGKPPELPLTCQARIRYRGDLTPATIYALHTTNYVLFATRVRAPAPGQFSVFYNDDVCLGGGVIS